MHGIGFIKHLKKRTFTRIKERYIMYIQKRGKIDD